MQSSTGTREVTGGVQSVARAFELLEVMADAGGVVGLSHLASVSGLPMPTIHRLIRTLVELGYVRQEPSKEYSLGPRLIPLGDTANRRVSVWARPQLARLVDTIGETANLAVLNGSEIVYVAQVPGRHSMRMFTEVGRRVSAHCTAVGKALMALMPPECVDEILAHTEMVAHTPNTITDRARYLRELEKVRAHGYAIDEGEQELGVRCVAVALEGGPTLGAVSISGPTTRMTDDLVERAVPELRAAADVLVAELTQQRTPATA